MGQPPIAASLESGITLPNNFYQNITNSLALSNWQQTKQNSNIIYNKVTNQQIQRHEVLISNKNELQSYLKRHTTTNNNENEFFQCSPSRHVCQLLYFHVKGNMNLSSVVMGSGSNKSSSTSQQQQYQQDHFEKQQKLLSPNNNKKDQAPLTSTNRTKSSATSTKLHGGNEGNGGNGGNDNQSTTNKTLQFKSSVNINKARVKTTNEQRQRSNKDQRLKKNYDNNKQEKNDQQQQRLRSVTTTGVVGVGVKIGSHFNQHHYHSQLYQQVSSQPQTQTQSAHTYPQLYYVYTDRMLPIHTTSNSNAATWTNTKLLHVLQAFKYLTNQYGLFKVRQHCICENQRKQIKVWINENPISNFVLEEVETEEDMIADLAALLVSKKQKIAKKLLDLKYFNQAIQVLLEDEKGEDRTYGKETDKGRPYKHQQNYSISYQSPLAQEISSQQRIMSPPTQHMRKRSQSQSNASGGLHSNSSSTKSPQVNNIYNVFINTDNSYALSSNSMQNSNNKYGLGRSNYGSTQQQKHHHQYQQQQQPVQQYLSPQNRQHHHQHQQQFLQNSSCLSPTDHHQNNLNLISKSSIQSANSNPSSATATQNLIASPQYKQPKDQNWTKKASDPKDNYHNSNFYIASMNVNIPPQSVVIPTFSSGSSIENNTEPKNPNQQPQHQVYLNSQSNINVKSVLSTQGELCADSKGDVTGRSHSSYQTGLGGQQKQSHGQQHFVSYNHSKQQHEHNKVSLHQFQPQRYNIAPGPSSNPSVMTLKNKFGHKNIQNPTPLATETNEATTFRKTQAQTQKSKSITISTQTINNQTGNTKMQPQTTPAYKASHVKTQQCTSSSGFNNSSHSHNHNLNSKINITGTSNNNYIPNLINKQATTANPSRNKPISKSQAKDIGKKSSVAIHHHPQQLLVLASSSTSTTTTNPRKRHHPIAYSQAVSPVMNDKADKNKNINPNSNPYRDTRQQHQASDEFKHHNKTQKVSLTTSFSKPLKRKLANTKQPQQPQKQVPSSSLYQPKTCTNDKIGIKKKFSLNDDEEQQQQNDLQQHNSDLIKIQDDIDGYDKQQYHHYGQYTCQEEPNHHHNQQHRYQYYHRQQQRLRDDEELVEQLKSLQEIQTPHWNHQKHFNSHESWQNKNYAYYQNHHQQQHQQQHYQQQLGQYQLSHKQKQQQRQPRQKIHPNPYELSSNVDQVAQSRRSTTIAGGMLSMSQEYAVATKNTANVVNNKPVSVVSTAHYEPRRKFPSTVSYKTHQKQSAAAAANGNSNQDKQSSSPSGHYQNYNKIFGKKVNSQHMGQTIDDDDIDQQQALHDSHRQQYQQFSQPQPLKKSSNSYFDKSNSNNQNQQNMSNSFVASQQYSSNKHHQHHQHQHQHQHHQQHQHQHQQQQNYYNMNNKANTCCQTSQYVGSNSQQFYSSKNQQQQQQQQQSQGQNSLQCQSFFGLRSGQQYYNSRNPNNNSQQMQQQKKMDNDFISSIKNINPNFNAFNNQKELASIAYQQPNQTKFIPTATTSATVAAKYPVKSLHTWKQSKQPIKKPAPLSAHEEPLVNYHHEQQDINNFKQATIHDANDVGDVQQLDELHQSYPGIKKPNKQGSFQAPAVYQQSHHYFYPKKVSTPSDLLPTSASKQQQKQQFSSTNPTPACQKYKKWQPSYTTSNIATNVNVYSSMLSNNSNNGDVSPNSKAIKNSRFNNNNNFFTQQRGIASSGANQKFAGNATTSSFFTAAVGKKQQKELLMMEMKKTDNNQINVKAGGKDRVAGGKGQHNDVKNVKQKDADENEINKKHNANPTSTPHQQMTQTKVKIRKQVQSDYQNLFGDIMMNNQVDKVKELESKGQIQQKSNRKHQDQQNDQNNQKEKQKKEKQRLEQEEKILQSNSSKDLIILEKVERQRKKHAQLKSDFSKLFD